MKEHDVARRMPGTMPHAELDVADPDNIAVFEPARRQTILGVAETGSAGIAAKLLQQEQVVLVRPLDRHAEFACEPGRAAGVIEMAMREEDLFQGHTLPRDGLFQAFDLPAGVDDRAPPGAHTPHQRTILLVGGDGQNNGLKWEFRHNPA